LIATPAGLPVAFALANPKIDEREVAIDLFDTDPTLLAGRTGQVLMADKGYASAEFEARLAERGVKSSALPAATNAPGPVPLNSRRCARSSNRSTPP
jgi:hypothetical protein